MEFLTSNAVITFSEKDLDCGVLWKSLSVASTFDIRTAATLVLSMVEIG
jgi:hypothetical protein